MKVLWDRELVRRMRTAVKSHSPDDWSASVRMGRHHRWNALKLSLQVLFGLVWVSLAISFPALKVSSVTVEKPGAFGLVALGLMGAGVIVVGLIHRSRSIAITPLIHTPARARTHYLCALNRLRRDVLCELGLAIGSGPLVMIWLRLASHGTWSLQTLPALFGGSIVLTASSLVWLWVEHEGRMPVFDLVKRLVGLTLLLASVAGYVWTLLRAKFADLPSPAGFGEWFLFLPQARLCGWLAGESTFPMDSFLFCAGEVVLASMAVFLMLRDRQPVIDEGTPLTATECTAEAVLAATVRAWRMKVWVQSVTADSHLDADDVDEVMPMFCSDGDEPPESPAVEPLQLHEDAPREHATLVSPAFKSVLAKRVRRHLDEPWSGVLPPHLSARHVKLPDWDRLLRWAVLFGVVVAVVAAIPGHLPSTMRKTGEGWCLVGGMLLTMGPIMWYGAADPSLSRGMRLTGWLPVEVRSCTEAMRAHVRTVFLRRLSFIAVLCATIVTVALVIIGLRSMLALPYEGLLMPSHLFSGQISVPIIAALLLAIAHIQRLLDTGSHAREWSQIVDVPFGYQAAFCALLLVSAASAIAGLLWTLMASESRWSAPISYAVPAAVLVGELSWRWCMALLEPAIGSTRSDWKA